MGCLVAATYRFFLLVGTCAVHGGGEFGATVCITTTGGAFASRDGVSVVDEGGELAGAESKGEKERANGDRRMARQAWISLALGQKAELRGREKRARTSLFVVRKQKHLAR